MTTELSLITGIMAVALPMSVAIFPQRSSIGRGQVRSFFVFRYRKLLTAFSRFSISKVGGEVRLSVIVSTKRLNGCMQIPLSSQ